VAAHPLGAEPAGAWQLLLQLQQQQALAAQRTSQALESISSSLRGIETDLARAVAFEAGLRSALSSARALLPSAHIMLRNTPSGHAAREDEVKIRSGAVANKISYCTNMAAAAASVKAIRSLKEQELTVKSIQEYHA
jgi:hypothetical protein